MKSYSFHHWSYPRLTLQKKKNKTAKIYITSAWLWVTEELISSCTLKKKKFFLQESVKWIKIKPIQIGVEFYECNCILSCVTGFMSLDWHFHLPRNLGVNGKCLPLWLSALEILFVVIYGSMKNVRENFILQLRSQRDQQKWTWIYGKKDTQTELVFDKKQFPGLNLNTFD